MNLEERNTEKRKKASLTIDEWFGFFFIPTKTKYYNLFPTEDFNDTEEERFKKFGFETKLRQASIARVLGFIFYAITIVLLGYFLK